MTKRNKVSISNFRPSPKGFELSSRQFMRTVVVLLFCFNLVIQALFPDLAVVTAANNNSLSAMAPTDNTSKISNNLSQNPNVVNSTGMASQQSQQQKAQQSYGTTPLSFEINQGQTDSKAKYIGRGHGYNFFFASDKVVLNLRKSKGKADKNTPTQNCAQLIQSAALPNSSAKAANNSVCPVQDEESINSTQGLVLNLNFLGGATNPVVEGQQPLVGKSNYFTGKSKANWHTDIPTFARLVYKQVYPGIDVTYYGNQSQLEYDFIIAPGADPGLITFNFEGADTQTLDNGGNLILSSGDAEIKQSLPVFYQDNGGGARQNITGSYVSKGNNQFGFKIDNYDHSKPLIIDPVLSYSSFLGGSSDVDYGRSVVVDSSGNAYLTGSTLGIGFPSSAGAYSTVYRGGEDAFITKLNTTGTALVYSSYLGGSGDDAGLSIAIDSSGNAFITGYTNTTLGQDNNSAFPITSGAYQPSAGSSKDAFVAKLNSSGSALVYSTYLGGSSDDTGKGIKVDSSGNAYVTGSTYSTNFPTTTGAYRTTAGGGGYTDIFVTKLNSTGTALSYSTYVGGNSWDDLGALAIDSSGQAYVGGYTTSTNFPTTTGAYKTTLTSGGGQDAIIFKLNATGTGLLYSTYIGSATGSQAETAESIGVDSAGKIYASGFTLSSDFVTTTGGYQRTYGGGRDGFLLKLNPAGGGTSDLLYSTFIGGNDYEETQALAVDPTTAGIVYVTGLTGSTNFPTTTGAFQQTLGGAWDAYIAKFNTTLSGSASLLYSTLIGGSANEIGRSIAVDSTGKVYITGNTLSSNYPVSSGAYQTLSKGNSDVFVSKLNLAGSGSSDLVYSTFLGGSGYDENNGLAVDGSGNAYLVSQTSSANFPTTVGAYKTTNSGSEDVIVSKLSADGTSLLYSTYLGGSGLDTSNGNSIAVDSSGQVYIVGSTTSTNFPTTSGAFQTANQAGTDQSSNDVFVTKLNATGTALVYSTYLGGNTNDFGRGIALDSSGNAYVTGYTFSTNFPTTTGAYRTTYAGGSNEDIFVTKLNTTGTALVYSTFMGGNGYDDGNSIAVDSSGQAHIVGTTSSTNFPTTTGAFHTTIGGGGGQDAYLFKLNAGGSGLLYSTYIGSSTGTGAEIANSVAVDSSGKVYITGITTSTGFPTTSGAFQNTYGGGSWDSFVLKMNLAGSGTGDLVYSSFIGGSGNDIANQIIKDSSGNAYVVGWTSSTNFPTSSGTYQTASAGGGNDAFVMKINPALSGSASLLYSTYLGGSGGDAAYGVGVDSSGNIYVSGDTSSTDFPNTAGTYQTSYGGGRDTFITKLALVIGTPILVSAVPGTQQVTLNWLAPNDVGAAAVTGYNVYRSVGGGSFTKVNGSAVTGTSYTDTGLTNETTYTYKITALSSWGEGSFSNTITGTPTQLPQDPATVAPALDRSVATTMISATNFLYTGANPIQTGIVSGTIDPKRVAVLRGRVLQSDGITGLSGVKISVLGHSEYGSTKSRSDGRFDLAVNGGDLLTVNYQLTNFIQIQRQTTPSWQDYFVLPDVIMLAYDPQVTTIASGSSAPFQVAQSSLISDTRGGRKATLLFPQGITATITLANGTTQPLSGNWSVRTTEFTVGANGPSAMPGELPQTTSYTYAAEFSIDEAGAAGATGVTFSQPVINYTQNFLNFPVGAFVPEGYYDRQLGQWIPSQNGRVIKILSITGGVANLDIAGNGTAATSTELAALGITSAEQQQLANLYPVGQTLWRVSVNHFSPWDSNWSGRFTDILGGKNPNQRGPGKNDGFDLCMFCNGSLIDSMNQDLGEAIGIAGTSFSLYYQSGQTPGHSSSAHLDIPLTDATGPGSTAKAVTVKVAVAGRTTVASFPSGPNLTYSFDWDGRDAYGRFVQGQQIAHITIGYVFPTVYGYYDFNPNVPFFNLPPRIYYQPYVYGWDITVTQEEDAVVTYLDNRGQGLGGWTLDANHFYDVNGKTLYMGDGTQRKASNAANVIDTVAGTNTNLGSSGDNGLAINASISPGASAMAADGTLYVIENYNNTVRKIAPNGIITTFAGGGFGLGEGDQATQAQLYAPVGLAIGPDGSLYIADNLVHRVRKVSPDGIITTVAGNGTFNNDGYGGNTDPGGFSGDGGPATSAQLSYPSGVAIGKDGSIYIADQGNHRIRRIGADGIIITIAGNGTSGFSGDGGLALNAQINPTSIAVQL